MENDDKNNYLKSFIFYNPYFITVKCERGYRIK
ncbi:MAG: hypothetical protein RCH30_0640 [Candidatus Phytoplasma australasiaticum]|nr:hypothetical protein EPWB_v2c0630 ['Echinacea purpurea' witches'-broom phytoplasma]WEX20187.1 MAG: hypothetical protein TB2022_0740 [Candidatus Phytoplasma aurantifolia]WKV63944.1 MAG: hypothetical protein NCHU2022_c0640 [Candidatus Phytoplasma australasiaticum]WMW49969.1 MAG: hypothetical protein RCH30_0640 [Candidatus Phytoplasma australasiaticum]